MAFADEAAAAAALAALADGRDLHRRAAAGAAAAAVLDWCVNAANTLLHDGTLTAAGGRLARALAVLLAERPDLVSVAVADWLGDALLPGLVGGAGAVAAVRGDVAYALLRALARGLGS